MLETEAQLVNAVLCKNLNAVKDILGRRNPKSEWVFNIVIASGLREMFNVFLEHDQPIRRSNFYTALFCLRFDMLETLSIKRAFEFDRTSNEVVNFLAKYNAYLALKAKIQLKRRHQAARKIYFWWLPICYDLRGERLAYSSVQNLLN